MLQVEFMISIYCNHIEGMCWFGCLLFVGLTTMSERLEEVIV